MQVLLFMHECTERIYFCAYAILDPYLHKMKERNFAYFIVKGIRLIAKKTTLSSLFLISKL